MLPIKHFTRLSDQTHLDIFGMLFVVKICVLKINSTFCSYCVIIRTVNGHSFL